MSLSRLIAKTVALPVKAVVAIPDTAAKSLEEIGKAVAGDK